jgi:hypothetical protein
MDEIPITDDSIGIFRDYIEMRAVNSSDIGNIAVKKIMAQSYEEGLMLLHEALKYYPENITLWNNRSVCYCELGLYIE